LSRKNCDVFDNLAIYYQASGKLFVAFLFPFPTDTPKNGVQRRVKRGAFTTEGNFGERRFLASRRREKRRKNI